MFDSPLDTGQVREGDRRLRWTGASTSPFDPDVCHGEECVRVTRVMVGVVLDNLAAGLTAEEIAESYPPVSVDAVTAALQYATDLARERTAPLGA